MGLIEQIQSGSIFKRRTLGLSNSPTTGYSDQFGATYILMAVSASSPCRIRLYADSGSVNVDALRPTSSFDYSASVALNIDVGLSAGTQSITFNPPVIATTLVNYRTWYNIESSTTPTNVVFTYYPIELNTGSRTWINIPNNTGISLGANETSSGNFSGSGATVVPKSFLMMSAISINSNIRLRLYSRPIEDISNTEKNRLFGTQSADGAHLIVDMAFDSGSYLYPISPLLQAYNLENYLSGSNRYGYIIENMSASPKTNVFTSIRTYPIED